MGAFFYSKSKNVHGNYCCDGITVGNCWRVGSTGNHWALITLQDLFTKFRKKTINIFSLGDCIVSGVS